MTPSPIKRIKAVILHVALLICLAVAGSVHTRDTFRISEKVLKQVEAQYGKDAVDRLMSWQELIRQDTSPTDLEKLQNTNDFFNRLIEFVNDIDLYGVNDYWATPIEFLARGAGDCEDFAIAKFFTLKAMGIAEEKLNITYVKALQYNISHMVLAYYPEPGAEPLVLDNLIDTINPAGQRTDLLPIFSFNGTGLWLAKQRGQGKPVGSAGDRLGSWRDLQERMSANEL
jgi:predicted transglutaminase-like cysteine proteinase